MTIEPKRLLPRIPTHLPYGICGITDYEAIYKDGMMTRRSLLHYNHKYEEFGALSFAALQQERYEPHNPPSGITGSIFKAYGKKGLIRNPVEA